MSDAVSKSRNRYTGYTGIYKTPAGRYQTYISIAGWVIPLGPFPNLQRAIQSREKAKAKKDAILTELQLMAQRKIHNRFNSKFARAKKRYRSHWG
jgi:hypothetical protein